MAAPMNTKGESSDCAGAGVGAASSPLTAREIQVLQLAADGMECSHTAEKLGLSRHYVKRVRCLIFSKLGADNTPHAVALGIRQGIIQ